MRLIAINTYKRFWRNKIVYIFAFVAFLLFLLGLVLSQLALGEQSKVVVDFSLAGIELVGLIFVLFYGSRLLQEEQEHKTIELLQLKVQHRAAIVLGKYLGFAMVLLVYIVLMTLVFFLLISWQGLDGNIFVWSLLAIVFVFFKLLVIFAFVFFFSLFMRPVLSLFLSVVIYIVAHSAAFLKYYYSVMVPDAWAMKGISNILYYLLPQFDVLSLKEYLFAPTILSNYSSLSIFSAVGFHLGYLFLLLFIATLVYRK